MKKDRQAEKELDRKKVNMAHNLISYYKENGNDITDVLNTAIILIMSEKQIKSLLDWVGLPENFFDVDYPHPKKDWHSGNCGYHTDENGEMIHTGFYPRDFKNEGLGC